MSDKSGGRQRDEVGAGAAAAQAAGGLDGDVGGRESGESVKGLKGTLSTASPVGAHPDFLNLDVLLCLR